MKLNSNSWLLLWVKLILLLFSLCTLQGVRNTLAGEESQVELIKAQLKDLFRFSEDSHHLSDDVLAVVKEHQRYVTGSLPLLETVKILSVTCRNES